MQIEAVTVRLPDRDRSERLVGTVGHREVGGQIESHVRPVQNPDRAAVRDPLHVAQSAAERRVFRRRPHAHTTGPGRLPLRSVFVQDRGERDYVQDRVEAQQFKRRAAPNLRTKIQGQYEPPR